MSNIHILLDLETRKNDEILADKDAITSSSFLVHYKYTEALNGHWSKI